MHPQIKLCNLSLVNFNIILTPFKIPMFLRNLFAFSLYFFYCLHKQFSRLPHLFHIYSVY
uniref:Uncharacterized protein n=1 Tax=Podoviridae sp. ctZ5d16 TaxID=2825257 RepID=A0A8S5Q825_9CAUD|nr:MAG TPA: hypothetical protein [Podoviridae sp. ctZ5d16]